MLKSSSYIIDAELECWVCQTSRRCRNVRGHFALQRDTELRGVLEDVNLREVNELIQSGDKRLTIAAADTAAVPTMADRVIIAGRTLQVIQVQTTEQDNEPITYELILRD